MKDSTLCSEIAQLQLNVFPNLLEDSRYQKGPCLFQALVFALVLLLVLPPVLPLVLAHKVVESAFGRCRE